MVYTTTSTKTTVSIIGDELAGQSETYHKISLMMKEIGIQYGDRLHGAGIRFVEKNDPADLSLIRMQWREIMPGVVPRNELTEINKLLTKGGPENPEQSSELKMK